MLEKLKSNLAYAFAAVIGVINFILFAIPYIAVYASYDLGAWGGKQTSSEGISGYDVMDLWEADFSGVMSSIIQILVLIVSIFLLAWGVMGLLKVMDIFDKFPDKLGEIESKKVCEYGLFAYAGLNVLLLIFLIILSVTNSESYSEFGYSGSAGIRLSAGIFITLVIGVGAVVALKVLEKKLPASENHEIVTYVCSKCGKKARASDKFCSACGGEIERKVTVKEEYACSKCGKRASGKDKFCSVCGGEIKVKEQEAPAVETTAQE